MLTSLGRCCVKQVRLGRDKDSILKERTLTGNTILMAQPTVDVPLGFTSAQGCLDGYAGHYLYAQRGRAPVGAMGVVDRAAYMSRIARSAAPCSKT